MKTFYVITCLIAICFGEISTDADNFSIELGWLEAKPHSIPFIVSLVFISEAENVTYCTGSLLNEHWILTTSYCLELYPQMHVVAGQHNIATFENTTQVRKGIGLIYVENGFDLTEEVQPVILGFEPAVRKGYVTIQGWGASLSSKVRVYPEYLRSTNISVVDKELCKVAYPKEFDEETNFCVNGTNRVSYVEQSGGPVMQNGVQVGIGSCMTRERATGNQLEVFIKVSAYNSWIQEQVFHASTLDFTDVAGEVNIHSGLQLKAEDLIQVNV